MYHSEYLKTIVMENMRQLSPSEQRLASILPWIRAVASFFCLALLGIILNPLIILLAFGAEQTGRAPSHPTTITLANGLPGEDEPAANWRSRHIQFDALQEQHRNLLANVPQANSATHLTTTNYAEDSALREAILADPARWQLTDDNNSLYYAASNALHVYLLQHPQTEQKERENLRPPLTPPDVSNFKRTKPSMSDSFAPGIPEQALLLTRQMVGAQGEQTLLTARILMGLWQSRRDDPRFSYQGKVALRADEILAWRGIQKHWRYAYPGAKKRFSDGYQWKQKQQVMQDLNLLQQYRVRGSHTLSVQGRALHLAVDSAYMALQPVTKTVAGKEEITGYLVAPGDWLHDYEQYNHRFLVDVDRRIFQLNPQNDQLALRIALYLLERWRQRERTGNQGEPLSMADLLAKSMISVDRANLTSRFAPRVEAALHKLHAQGILGAAPACLSCIDRTQAHWGKTWLAAYWQLLPANTVGKNVSVRLRTHQARNPE